MDSINDRVWCFCRYYRVHAEVHDAEGCAGAWEFEARYSSFHKMHAALKQGIALGAKEGMTPDGSGRLRIGGMTLPPFPPKQKISFNLKGLGPRLRGDKDGAKQKEFVRKRRAALHTYVSSLVGTYPAVMQMRPVMTFFNLVDTVDSDPISKGSFSGKTIDEAEAEGGWKVEGDEGAGGMPAPAPPLIQSHPGRAEAAGDDDDDADPFADDASDNDTPADDDPPPPVGKAEPPAPAPAAAAPPEAPPPKPKRKKKKKKRPKPPGNPPLPPGKPPAAAFESNPFGDPDGGGGGGGGDGGNPFADVSLDDDGAAGANPSPPPPDDEGLFNNDSPSKPAAKKVTAASKGLFDDDDSDDGGLFADEKPKKKKDGVDALFDDSDDDDGPLKW